MGTFFHSLNCLFQTIETSLRVYMAIHSFHCVYLRISFKPKLQLDTSVSDNRCPLTRLSLTGATQSSAENKSEGTHYAGPARTCPGMFGPTRAGVLTCRRLGPGRLIVPPRPAAAVASSSSMDQSDKRLRSAAATVLPSGGSLLAQQVGWNVMIIKAETKGQGVMPPSLEKIYNDGVHL